MHPTIEDVFIRERAVAIEQARSFVRYSSDNDQIAGFLGWSSWDGGPSHLIWDHNKQPWQIRPITPYLFERENTTAKYITSHNWSGGPLVMGDGPPVITEGFAKAATLAQAGFKAIALVGVWLWVDGQDDQGLHQLVRQAIGNEDVIICFDADVVFKRSVRLAMTRLIKLIGKDRCQIVIPEGAKGIDDVNAAFGIDRVKDLLNSPISVDRFLGTPEEFNAGDRIKAYEKAHAEGYKHVLDNSGCGSGKSHAIPGISPEAFECESTWLISKDHRNPSIPEIALQFRDMPTRHNGLHRKGNGSVYTTSPDRPANIDGNCEASAMANFLSAKGYEMNLCQECPMSFDCNSYQGKGIGYLKAKRAAMAATKKRIAADSLPTEVDQYQDALLIHDEVSLSLKPKVYQVSWAEFEMVSGYLSKNPTKKASLQPLLDQIVAAAKSDEKWGVSSRILNKKAGAPTDMLPERFSIQTALPGIDMGVGGTNTSAVLDLQIEAFKDLPTNFMIDLIESWQGGRVSYRVYGDRITITKADSRQVLASRAAKMNVYQDASISRMDLAVRLGIPPTEIKVVRQSADSFPENLSILQVIGVGSMKSNRSDKEQRLASSAVRWAREQYGDLVAVFDHKSTPTDKDGHYFSDSVRGSNAFKDKSVFLQFGLPRPNYGAIEDRWFSFNGHQSELKEHYNEVVVAELVQAIGRARATRREDVIYYCIFTDDPLPKGWPVRKVAVAELKDELP